MEKEKLIALGTALGITITDELAESILKYERETLDGNYVPKTRFDEVNEKNKTLTTQLSERDTSITQLKKDLEDKPSKEKVEQLEQLLANKDKEHALQLAGEIKKVKIISEIAGKVHDNDLTVSLLNLDKITVEDNGTVIGLKEQLDSLKQAKSFLFKSETPAQSTSTQTTKPTDDPAQGVSSPNVASQQNGDVAPEDKVVSQRDAIIEKMIAKQKLNQSKISKGDE